MGPCVERARLFCVGESKAAVIELNDIQLVDRLHFVFIFKADRAVVGQLLVVRYDLSSFPCVQEQRFALVRRKNDFLCES